MSISVKPVNNSIVNQIDTAKKERDLAVKGAVTTVAVLVAGLALKAIIGGAFLATAMQPAGIAAFLVAATILLGAAAACHSTAKTLEARLLQPKQQLTFGQKAANFFKKSLNVLTAPVRIPAKLALRHPLKTGALLGLAGATTAIVGPQALASAVATNAQAAYKAVEYVGGQYVIPAAKVAFNDYVVPYGSQALSGIANGLKFAASYIPYVNQYVN